MTIDFQHLPASARPPERASRRPLQSGFTNELGIRYVRARLNGALLARAVRSVAESMQTARIAGLVLAVCIAAAAASGQEPSDPRQRQAAAEAYDQGTAAYLSRRLRESGASGSRLRIGLSPAAPALIQAARSLQQAGQAARAATLALRLTPSTPNNPPPLQFGERMLEQLSGQLVRVEVTCGSCTLDVDGSLQEWSAFYRRPRRRTHTVIASFETGDAARRSARGRWRDGAVDVCCASAATRSRQATRTSATTATTTAITSPVDTRRRASPCPRS